MMFRHLAFFPYSHVKIFPLNEREATYLTNRLTDFTALKKGRNRALRACHGTLFYVFNVLH